MSDKPQSTEPRPDVSRETPEIPIGAPAKPTSGFVGRGEAGERAELSAKPEAEQSVPCLDDIISRSLAEQEAARSHPAGDGPEPSPGAPQEGGAPPPPTGDGKQPPVNKRTAVYRYLLVLFGAAFVLLLLAYFVQQRDNENTINDLRDTMNLSRADLMEEIDGLREENERQKDAIQDLEDAKAQAEEARDGLKEENAAYSQMVESNRLDLEKCQALAWLERFVREKDYLMAAVGISGFNHWFDWNWKTPPVGGQAPLPGQQTRFRELRQEVLDHSDYLLAEPNPRATEDNPMLWITLTEDLLGSEEWTAALRLWALLSKTDSYLIASDVAHFYGDDGRDVLDALNSGAFQPSTAELLEQIKRDLILRGWLSQGEDGTLTVELTDSGDDDDWQPLVATRFT